MHQLYFSNPNNFITPEQMAWCADYCKKFWPEDCAHILRIAEDAKNHTFLFDLRWDMERTYEPVHFDGEIQWDFMPKDDPEFIYQFNRCQYFICLGQAYALTGDSSYAKAFAEQLLAWIQANPFNENTRQTVWRSIEAGIRGETWVKAMSYFKDSPYITDELMEQFCECLKTHARYLMDSYQIFQVKSNWGVIESRGLLEIALALKDEKEAEKWKKTAVSRLEEGIRVQILDDGVQWEQSPMYHNEVFHCALEAIRLSRRYGYCMSDEFLAKIHKMAYANLLWKKPNHCQIAQGDSDETDLRDLLSQSAYLFQDPELKYGGYDRLDFDGAWDYLQEGAESYEKIVAQKPEKLFYKLENSGNVYIRSGWGENDDFFHFRCGSLGGGHGHSDKLHIDLAINGEDILIDPGRYHYVDGEIRHELKNSCSHNTPSVDGKDYLVCLDSWGISGMTPAYQMPVCEKNGFRLVQGGHGGYLHNGKGNVYIQRKVLALGTDLYVVADEFFAGEEHTFQQNYHFHPDGILTACEGENRVHYTGRNVESDFLFFGNSREETNVYHSRMSRNYNQMEENMSIQASCKKDGFGCLLTVIAGGKKGEYKTPKAELAEVSSPARGRILTEEEAHGLRITWKGKTYLVLMGHKDIGGANEMLGSDGYMGLGSVIVFEEDQEKTGGTVLYW